MPNIKKTTFNVEPDRSENADIFQFFKIAWGKTSSENSKELKNIKHKKRLHVKTLNTGSEEQKLRLNTGSHPCTESLRSSVWSTGVVEEKVQK